MCPATHASDQQALTANDRFRFACHDSLPCFTQCCRDVNIYLTPYDVLRLCKALQMGSGDFLARHTRHFLARVTNIPVVQLAMHPETLCCPFVKDSGCSVYHDRPWACRMFPLDLASADGEYRTIAGRERCLGLLESSTRTVGEWLKTQGVAPYMEMEHAFHLVMPAAFKPGAPMDAGLGKLLFFAYDLDRFRRMLDDARFLAFHEIREETLLSAREDDVALLLLSFRYIRSQMEELYPVVRGS